MGYVYFLCKIKQKKNDQLIFVIVVWTHIPNGITHTYRTKTNEIKPCSQKSHSSSIILFSINFQVSQSWFIPFERMACQDEEGQVDSKPGVHLVLEPL